MATFAGRESYRDPVRRVTSHRFGIVGPALVAAACLASATLAAERAPETRLPALFAQSGLPGLCVAVVDRDGPRFSAGFGLADVATGAPYTVDTVQPVGSVSKTLVGLMLAEAAERDEIDLDSPADAAMPWPLRHPRFPDSPITWRQLATHTASIVDAEAAYARAYVPGPALPPPMEPFVREYFDAAAPKAMAQRFGEGAPGTAYRYSNMGAAYAAVALEVRLGRRFDALVAERVLEPLGMTASGWRFDPALGPRNATLYAGAAARGPGKPLSPYTLLTWADGGLRSSCRDLGRYLTTLLRAHAGASTPLSSPAVRRMLAPQFAANATPPGLPDTEPNQGLFWQFRRNGTIGHSGGDPGLSAFIALDLATGRGRVLLTNADLEERPKARQAFTGIWSDLATR